MNNRTLFRKWSVFLACFAFCGQQAFAAGGSASPLEITVLVVVILLALLFVLAAFYLRKMYAGFSSQSQKAVKEKELLALNQIEIEQKNNELEAAKKKLEEQKEAIESKAAELESERNELESQYNVLSTANKELVQKLSTQETMISTLNSNKKDLEQLLVTKIKESDAMQREVADRLSEAESRLKDAEMIHDNFFIETIHEMRTPLSLLLGSWASSYFLLKEKQL